MSVLLLACPGLIVALAAWVTIVRRFVAPRIVADVSCSVSSIAHGTDTDITVTLRNPTCLPCPVVTCELELPQGLQSAAAPEGRASFTVALGGREVVRIRLAVTGVKRGRQHIQNLILRVSDGFTAHRDSKQENLFLTVTVHPRRIQTAKTHARLRELGLVTSTRKLAATSVDWVDMHSYQAGDSISDIAWMTSARRGELIVLDRAVSMNQQVVLIASVRVSDVMWEVSEAQADCVYETVFAMMEEMTRRGLQFLFYCDAQWPNERCNSHRQWLLRGEGVWSPRAHRQAGHVLGSLSISAATSVIPFFDEIEREGLHPSRIVFLTGHVDPAVQQRTARMQRRGYQVDHVWLRPPATDASPARGVTAP